MIGCVVFLASAGISFFLWDEYLKVAKVLARGIHEPCAFCGLSRGFRALWLGQWEAAATYHPAIYWVFGSCLVLGMLSLFKLFLILNKSLNSSRNPSG